MPRCLQLLQLLIYQSRHLGNDLGQATDTELPIHNVESFVNIGQKLLWMPNQLRTKSLLGSAPNSILSLNRPSPIPSSLPMTTWIQRRSWNGLSALSAEMGTGQISRLLYSNGS